MLKIVYYTDPGHGWFAVKTALLYRLDIEDKISPYSYTRGKTAYLEEDCDAEVLFNFEISAHADTILLTINRFWFSV